MYYVVFRNKNLFSCYSASKINNRIYVTDVYKKMFDKRDFVFPIYQKRQVHPKEQEKKADVLYFSTNKAEFNILLFLNKV